MIEWELAAGCTTQVLEERGTNEDEPDDREYEIRDRSGGERNNIPWSVQTVEMQMTKNMSVRQGSYNPTPTLCREIIRILQASDVHKEKTHLMSASEDAVDVVPWRVQKPLSARKRSHRDQYSTVTNAWEGQRTTSPPTPGKAPVNRA